MNIRELNELAQYNSEVSRGLVHTDGWRERMEKLQRQFDMERTEKLTGGPHAPSCALFRRNAACDCRWIQRCRILKGSDASQCADFPECSCGRGDV